MPQVVACHGCGQHFSAADHLLGSIVACPGCGSALALPAPQPVAPLRALPPSEFRRPSHAPQQQRLIAIIVVSAACALWLVLAFPNVLLWAAGRPAASLERVGAGAVIFWVGVLLACGGVFEWSLFRYSRDMRATQKWFGEQGARWFYAGLGSVAALLGLGMTAWASAYSLFGTTVKTAEKPDFTVQQQVVQPLTGPQVSSPPPASTAGHLAPAPASASNASKSRLTPVAAEKVPSGIQQPVRSDFSALPGQWRYLEGGYCIKVPEAIIVTSDSITMNGGETHQEIRGGTLVGKPEGVLFKVAAWIDPRRREADSRQLLESKRRQPPPNELNAELILVNGLEVVKTTMRQTQTGPLSRRAYTLRGTNYHFAENHLTITLSVYSQLPLEHQVQRSLAAYLNTFQRMPQEQATSAGLAPKGAAAEWQLLQRGFRIRTSRLMEIRLDKISRHGRDWDETTHNLHGQTSDDVQFKIDVTHLPAWDKPNDASRTAAERSRHPRPDYEHVAVDVNGLLMERITHRLPPGRAGGATVEYRYQQGQNQIVMWAHSRLPLDHPSFHAVLRCFETIQPIAPP